MLSDFLGRLDKAGVQLDTPVLDQANAELRELSGTLADQAQQAASGGFHPPLLTRPHDWPAGR
jgi:hypothetical protein